MQRRGLCKIGKLLEISFCYLYTSRSGKGQRKDTFALCKLALIVTLLVLDEGEQANCSTNRTDQLGISNSLISFK